MATLSDPAILEHFREALRERDCPGYVMWKRVPREWLAKYLEGQTQQSIGQLLHEHVSAGLKIDQVAETREIHRDRHRFHYDFRIAVDGRDLYVETTLDVTKTGPLITIVSIHDA